MLGHVDGRIDESNGNVTSSYGGETNKSYVGIQDNKIGLRRLEPIYPACTQSFTCTKQNPQTLSI